MGGDGRSGDRIHLGNYERRVTLPGYASDSSARQVQGVATKTCSPHFSLGRGLGGFAGATAGEHFLSGGPRHVELAWA